MTGRFFRGTPGSDIRGIPRVNPRIDGFTLIELMVVLGIAALVAVVAYAAYRQGLYREYGQSAQVRALVNALHLAQWRALKGGTSIPITNGLSIDPDATGWFRGVQITTAFPHSFKVGDWVTFSDLAALPPLAPCNPANPLPGHSGMNVGKYYVTTIGAGASPTTFQVSFYSQVDPCCTDIPTAPPYPSPPPVPMVRNATGASKLVIMKRAAIAAVGGLSPAVITGDPQNFVYDDLQMFVWAYTAGGYASPDVAGAPTDATYLLTVRFTSRGLPADPAGYQLVVGRTPADFGSTHPSKIITIRPSGKINPGSS